MNLEFNVFRVTNALVLFLSGFCVFILFMAVPAVGFNVISIVPLFIFGACFIHSILSRALQRHWVMPSMPLKDSTPGGIRIMSIIAMLAVFVCIKGGVQTFMLTDSQIKEIAEQLPEPSNATIPLIARKAGVFLILMAILLLMNIILSLRLLKKVVIRQHTSQDEE